MRDFDSQNLANTAWAFAIDFNSQDLTNIAWAFENICSVEAAAALGFHYPFQADRGDRCETSLRAHEDSGVFLDLVASLLRKNRSILSPSSESSEPAMFASW